MDYQSRAVIQSDDFTFGKKLFIGRKTPAGMEILYSDKVVLVKEGEPIIEPSLRMNDEEFQALVDAIHKDYKPSEGKFIEGKLVATEKHLEDMRKLLKLK